MLLHIHYAFLLEGRLGGCEVCASHSPLHIRVPPSAPPRRREPPPADLIGNMVDPSSPEGQAILQQVGVSYDDVVFYMSSNLVGKRVRGRVLLSPDHRGADHEPEISIQLLIASIVFMIHDHITSLYVCRSAGWLSSGPEIQNVTGWRRSPASGTWDPG